MKTLLKKTIASVLTIGGLFAMQASHAAQPQDLKGKNVVLVHGAFADGAGSWAKVIPLLEARGLHVVAVQNPLSSLQSDVDATKRVIDQQTGPVVLVGHSWGGAVITEAGNDDKVNALVYVAAFAPDNGQSINDMVKGQPAPSWASELQKDSAGYLTLSTKAVLNDFAQDLPVPQRRLIAATQGPLNAANFDDKISTAAWHDKPTSFVIPGQDHMIDPRLQAAEAQAMHASVTHVNGSHVVMVSQPQAVANAIIAAASKIQ
jgi:pimeloyl-ACP methyl ester carboxylesterase